VTHEEAAMTKRTTRWIPAAALSLLLTGAAVAAPGAPDAKAVERGKYLVTIMLCNDCHTPQKMGPNGPEPDLTRTLSGHPQEVVMPPPPQTGHSPWNWGGTGTMTAFHGPWGVSFAANLTPDAETGIGKWTEKTFVDALRNGKYDGVGRPLLPPMPWPMIGKATDEDLHAIFAYLKSLPPVKNRVPQPIDPPQAE
jgi:mono/diheme cytochrome c family protein